MSDETERLRRVLRYVLETSLAQSDAEESVETLDELVRQSRISALIDAAEEMERQRRNEFFLNVHEDSLASAAVMLRRRATEINCMDPELCTTMDPCPRCE